MPWSKDALPESVKNKNWSDAQKERFVATANAVLEKTGDEGESIATGTKQAESEHRNANQFPKAFYCRHMQPGICGYGDEKVLVDTDAMKRMIGNDVIGKPVYILHNEAPNDERLKKLQEEAAGYITDSFYNELDGWAWFEILAISDSAHQAIAQGWKVSNAYIPTEWAPGGTKNNVAFQREIKNGVFTHLAIVPDPRYEDADIMTPEKFKAYQESKRRQLLELQNAKSDQPKGTPMFKFFKNERKEVSASAIDADTMVELEDGSTVSVKEMQNAMKKNEAESAEDKAKREEAEKKNFKETEAQEMENAMVDCDGEKMPLKELVNRFKAMKKNAAEAEEKKNADDKAKKDAEEKANAEEKEKQNARFAELQNANNRAAETVTVIEMSIDKVARGKAAYGSAARTK